MGGGTGVEEDGSGSGWSDGKEGTASVTSSRRFAKTVFIALTGLGSSVSERVLVLVGILGAISEALIALGLNGCRSTSSNDFLIFSTVNALVNGSLIACRKACLFIFWPLKMTQGGMHAPAAVTVSSKTDS